MIYGGVPGMQNMSSRLFLKRFQPETTEITENAKEAQEIIDALAACDNQTAVENDMKVRTLFNHLPISLTLQAHSCMHFAAKQVFHHTSGND